jgi:hypothetical protein
MSAVESRTGAVATLRSLRLPSPLIKPDVRISRIRLSDRLRCLAHGGVRGRLHLATQLPRKSSDICGVVRLIANHRSSTSSKAHLKQGSFPPPPLPGFTGTMTLSDSHRVRIAAAMELKLRPNGSPTLPASPLRRAVPTTPADQMGASVDLLPHPYCLPLSRRVGIRNCTFEACSGFTRITAHRIARPPARPWSRGFSAASCPTTPLVSFQFNRLFSGWNPPPQVIRALVAHRDARGPEETNDSPAPPPRSATGSRRAPSA